MNDSKSINRILIIIALVFLGIYMAISVATDPRGGLAALVPLIATLLTIYAFINTKNGLYGLAALVIWVDEFKRLAVYFGGVNSLTVIQTLAMPFVVLAGLHAGFFLKIVLGKYKLDRIGILLYVLAGVIGISVFATMDAPLAQKAQRAANLAGYISLIPIAYTCMKTIDEWRNFFAFQCLVALPAAAWAIKQYYMGFDDIEWFYARSGLSATHQSQMFLFENPRVFGFFGSASALGCAAIYCAFSWWHAIVYSKHRLLWILVAGIYSFVLFTSTQRTALLYPILILPFVFCFRRPSTTLAVYIACGALFVSAVLSSSYLLDEGLTKINNAIASEGSWGERVLRVSTFSDRLRGWERLTKAENYSLFGTGKETYSDATDGPGYHSDMYSHDIINRILINYGIVGILITAFCGLILAYNLHTIVYRQQSQTTRNTAAFILALSYPMILLSLVGGDNFNTNPLNIQIWTAIAGVFVCKYQLRADADARKSRQNLKDESRHSTPTHLSNLAGIARHR